MRSIALLCVAIFGTVLASAQVTEAPRVYGYAQNFGQGGINTVEQGIASGTAVAETNNAYCTAKGTGRFGIVTANTRVDPPALPQYYGTSTIGTARGEWWDNVTAHNPLYTGQIGRVTFRIAVNATVAAQGAPQL